MKSRTSFFNLTLYKKDITRFAPLWVLYTVGMLLQMIPMASLNEYFKETVRTLNSTIGPYSIWNLGYGVLTAQLLFGELFNARLCNALHAMPVTREARFGSHVLAGLSFSIAPNLLVGLLMMPSLQEMWYLSLLWWLALTLQYLFFFGVAVFAMFCTGNRFAAALVYAIINFGSIVALWFVNAIFIPMMRGVVLDSEVFVEFAPVVQMCADSDYFVLETKWNMDTQIVGFAGLGQSWLYLVIYAAIGVLVIAGSVLLYRRRALECAGDFMAVKVLKPVFLLLYTLCAGAFLAMFGSIFGGDIYLVFLIVGLIVGFFTGTMLLERTVRVFQWKSFLQLGIFVVLMWLALQAVQFDVFGIVRYVPQPDAVAKAEVLTYYRGRTQIKTSNPEELAVLQKAHGFAIAEEGCKHSDQRSYQITYHMKNGRTIQRNYLLCHEEAAAAEFDKLLSSPKAILDFDGTWDNYIKSVTSIRVTGLVRENFLDEADWNSFLDAVYDDCKTGMMSDKGGDVTFYDVTIWRGEESVYLELRQFSNALNWLREYEQQDLQNYLKTVTAITIDEEEIAQEQYKQLLAAIYADCRDYTLSWENGDKDKEGAAFTIGIETDGNSPEKVFWIHEYMENTYKWIKEFKSNPQGV